jgi:hypothetical protein
MLTDGQRDPLVPFHRANEFIALDVERGRDVRRHLAERVLRRADVDRLPVAVQHQHNVLIQHIIHKISWCLFFVEVANGTVL